MAALAWRPGGERGDSSANQPPDEGGRQGSVERQMKAALGARVRREFLGEAVKQRTAEGKNAQVILEGGIAKESLRQRERWDAIGDHFHRFWWDGGQNNFAKVAEHILCRLRHIGNVSFYCFARS